MAQMKTLTVGNSTYTVMDPEAVSFQQPQQLSLQQQEQAQRNIGVWSGQSVLERLCPPFTEEGDVVVTSPMEESLLQITADLEQKNLFCCDEDKQQENAGVVCQKTKGVSWVTLNGATMNGASFVLNRGLQLEAGTYTISLFGANVLDRYNDRVYIQYKNTAGADVYVNNITAQYPASFTLGVPTTVTVYFVLGAGSGYSNERVAVQIERGVYATDYAPHSPYTQLQLYRCGKNLCRTDTALDSTISGLEIYRQIGQSHVRLNGTSQIEQALSMGSFLLKAGTYTASLHGANAVDTDHDRLFLEYVQSDGKTVIINNIMTGKPKTFTLSEDVKMMTRLVVAAGSAYVNAQVAAQIEQNDYVTEYEPYRGDAYTVELNSQTPIHGGSFCWSTGVLTDQNGEVSQYPAQQIRALPGDNRVYGSGRIVLTGRRNAVALMESLEERLAALEAAAVKHA